VAIDWAATGAMIAGLGSFAGAGAILYAGYLGKSAIEDFRAQKLADKEIEAAEAAMTAAYRAEEAVEAIRGRWIPAGEIHASKEELEALGGQFENLDNETKEAYIQRGVIYRRAEFFKSDFDAVFEAIPMARAYFDDAVVDALRAFPRARNRILSSADMLPMMTKNARREDSETYQSIRSDVYASPHEGKNEVSSSVTEAISTLENALRKKLRNE
jgi:hypothetical protein